MLELPDVSSSSPSWGGYTSLGQSQDQRVQRLGLLQADGQQFPLKDQSGRTNRYNHYDDETRAGSDFDKSTKNEFRVTFADQDQREAFPHSSDDNDERNDDEDEDEDYEDLDDNALLDNGYTMTEGSSSSWRSKFSQPRSSKSKILHPCRILASVFGTAMVVSLAFGLFSLLNLNTNRHIDPNRQGDEADSRVLKPPTGISIDDFKLSDFQLPPWEWDINSFLPINITNGPKFTQIQWKDGQQYLAVDCPHQSQYQYHFPSFPKNQFQSYSTVSQSIDDLLHLGEEPYVFVLCPPGINNANVVFRQFNPPEGVNVPDSPPHIEGTMGEPQPLVDDVVMLLVDAISRAKFTIAMKDVMTTLANINTTAATGHRIFDFEHYNVLGQNSPPNKAFIYSGQSIENMKNGPKHWLWDVYEEQGFKTAHTDGECGGQQGIHDYTTGAITFEYAHVNQRIPAQYQMSQTSWCENHNMHVESGVWGQSCKLPEGINYDTTLMGGMRWNTPYCAGEKAIHEHIMENLEGWLANSKGVRRFATYSFMDAHSPDHHHISFDDRLATLLQNLLVGRDDRPPLLSPNSVLVIMADHGLHYGRETFTFPGFIHHKIPPLFVALPNQLLNTRPEFLQALEQNQNRIISHLDLHQTFLHLAYGDMPVEKSNNGAQSYADFMTEFLADGTFRRQFHATAPNQTSFAQIYGQSLLLPIAEDRSCRTAGIPHDFCAFQPFMDLDPSRPVDATFLRGALLLLAKKMNEMTLMYRVNDICHDSSLNLEPGSLDAAMQVGTFEGIGTEDLVMEAAYASAAMSRIPNQQQPPPPPQQQQHHGHHDKLPDTRIFYFMIRNRHLPETKYSVTMREDELVMGKTDSMTIQQMSAYADSWRPCARRISRGGKAVGNWQNAVKHFCVCS